MNQIQKTYAEALIQIDTIKRSDVISALKKVQDIIDSSQDLYNTLVSPITNTETKIHIIEDIFSKEVQPEIINFLKLLAEKNKYNELQGITEAYIKKSNDLDGIQTITVTSAVELKDIYKKQIIEVIQNKLNKTINAEWITNSEIIGGLVIKIDDNIIDTSIANKLKKLMKGNL